MDWGEIIITLTLDLILTMFFYLLVPVIFCIRNKPMTAKQIKKVVYINGAIVWFLMALITGDPTMAVFLWSWVGSVIMKRVLLKDAKNEELIYYCQFCGYEQKDNFEFCPQCGKNTNQDEYINIEKKPTKNHSKKISNTGIALIVVSVLLVAACVALVLPHILDDNDSEIIKYESYYVGVRAITLSDEFTAKYILSTWKNGEATEKTMIALMDQYGASQGGGKLHLVEPGDWIEEVDAWCFDRSRKVGDVAIIENPYGYTICYFSSVTEK